MCNRACLTFGQAHLSREEIRGKDVIEVGARDVNGSLRRDLEAFGPRRYLGVDIEMGPGVDEICDITGLVDRYGAATFDVVISTEVMEHVRPWREAISNLKRLLRPGGILLLTTRSKGFPYHGYPYDFWRYEADDIRAIFADMTIESLEPDTVSPGIFVKVRRPATFVERDLAPIQLYSIVTHRRSDTVTDRQVYIRRLRHLMRRRLSAILPRRVMQSIDRAVTGPGPSATS